MFPLAAGLEDKQVLAMLSITSSLGSGSRGPSTQKLSLVSVMGGMQLMGKAIKRGKSQAGRQCLVNLACLGLGT